MQYYIYNSVFYHVYTLPSDTIFWYLRATVENQSALTKLDTGMQNLR